MIEKYLAFIRELVYTYNTARKLYHAEYPMFKYTCYIAIYHYKVSYYQPSSL